MAAKYIHAKQKKQKSEKTCTNAVHVKSYVKQKSYSRSSSVMPVLERVFSSTVFTITAQ